MSRHYNRAVEGEELKILLSLEADWTISINDREFVRTSTTDIEVTPSTIEFGRLRRKIIAVEWVRPNIPRITTISRLRNQPDILTFYPGPRLPSAIDLRRRRRAFQAQLAKAFVEYSGRRAAIKQILYSDKQHGIGGAYPRFVIGNHAVIAVDPDEPSPVLNGIMRAAILWSQILSQRISVIVPALRCGTLIRRIKELPRLRENLEWLQWDGDSIQPLDFGFTEIETRIHDYQEPAVGEEVSRICALAPDLLLPVQHIPERGISIRLRGLEIARVTEKGTAYPMGEPLEPLIETLRAERRHGSSHPLAKAYEERWLESNLIRQIQDILPVGNAPIYPQVPSFVGESRSIIDLLTITKEGRLAVIEIKASADPDLPFQAFDYWLAVERHRMARDFPEKGYFPHLQIRDEPALLMVVAPLLAFHRTLDTLVAELPRNLPWVQIGINQSWKRGIKILRRKGTLS